MSLDAPKPQSHLINIICANRDHQPTFSLFLGAGASKSSGVKTASEMILQWREMFCKIHGNNAAELDVFKIFDWYDTEREYAELFGRLFDSPSQRREFIEKCVASGRPSWGYIYLTNLMANEVFDTIFTTNFDDLLNEACYRFSDTLRPMICAHDSSIGLVRISSKRPKVIKVHGDYLYDNIKNTERELESLEENTKAKFRQFAREYGMIVLGYSGSDRSVMDTIDSLLKDEQNFPAGIYWCTVKGSRLSRRVQEILRFPKVRQIEITGFDDFFAELNDELGLPLLPEIAQPYDALRDRLNRLLPTSDSEPTLHHRIRQDVERLANEIKSIEGNAINSPDTEIRNIEPVQGQTFAVESDASHRIFGKSIKNLTPFVFLAEAELLQGKAPEAATLLLKHTGLATDWNALHLASRIMCQLDASRRAVLMSQVWKALSKLIQSQEYNDLLTYIGLNLILCDEPLKALHVFDAMAVMPAAQQSTNFNIEFNAINQGQCQRATGNAIPQPLLRQLENISNSSVSMAAQWGAAVVLDQQFLANNLYSKWLINNRMHAEQAMTWPIWRLFKITTQEQGLSVLKERQTTLAENNDKLKESELPVAEPRGQKTNRRKRSK